MADRFSQILKTYLRGIRDRLETKATLMKPFLSGGLSFDEDSAGKVMSLAEKIVNPVKSRPAGIPPEAELFNVEPLPKIKPTESEKIGLAQRPEIARDAAYDFSRLAKKGETAAQAVPTEAMPKIAPEAQEISLTLAKKAEPKEPPLASATTGNVGTMPLIKLRFQAENLNQNPKTRVEDVKYVPRVMGPLDEIKYMDLINFRRLDREPIKSAGKIKNKISLLEEENYGKKLEGIKYWRSCPLYKLYLAIGNLSIGENKPIDVIIEERKMAGLDYLTDEEFKVIMDLNKSLRF